MIDEDFRTLLVLLLPTSTIVEKGKISEEQITTRVFFQKSNENNDLDLDGTGGLVETTFDVEVAALNDDDTAQTMALQLGTVAKTLTTLNGAINASVTSVVVNSVANLPANGLPFIVIVDSEKLKITAISGTTLTVVRGYKSTTAASHLTGASVTVIGLNGFRGTSGNTFFHGVLCNDQNDDYQPKMLDADEGYAVVSFQALVIHE